MYHYVNPGNNRRRRRQMQLLVAVCIILAIACVSLAIAYRRTASASRHTGEMLVAKMQTEASNAYNRALSLSNTTGSSSTAIVAATRQHVYAMQVLNSLASGIYGAGTILVDSSLLDDCIKLLDECDAKQAAGNVLTTTYTNLQSAIALVYQSAEGLTF